jgi:translation initiation factor 2 beta subunit (eIF-2beta)/eIF-5
MNIQGLQPIDDPFYRYRMPIPKYDNTGLTNLPQIAKDLNREPEMIIKFLKHKFSSSCVYKNNVLTLPKNTTPSDFNNAIYEFIEYVVLCPLCRLPETIIEQDNDKIYISCKCCSYNKPIDNKNISKTANKFYDNLKK